MVSQKKTRLYNLPLSRKFLPFYLMPRHLSHNRGCGLLPPPPGRVMLPSSAPRGMLLPRRSGLVHSTHRDFFLDTGVFKDWNCLVRYSADADAAGPLTEQTAERSTEPPRTEPKSRPGWK
mmetsp:Transcript_2812/g.7882  ORF Transcript_2812/g.7882 Transcript_2812/m.7882 type:complete len:120 (-) Transcript_2812:389-748(-)